MRIATKLLLFTLSLFLISNFAFSQQNEEDYYRGAGVYKTYEDYLTNNLTDYGSYSSVFHVLGYFTVTFEDESGKKTEIKIKDGNIWGYVNNDESVYRINDKGHPCKIIATGKIMIYGNYTESGYTTTTTRDFKTGVRSTHTSSSLYSFGANGEMKVMTKNSISKELKKRKDKEGLEMLKKVNVFKGYWVKDFVYEYNKKFKE